MPINILLVSDSADDRQNIRESLSEFNVLTATSEEEVKRVFEDQEEVYLMLLDLDIPTLDGIQLLRALKADERHQYLRTIILSDCDQRKTAAEELALGIVDCSQKPHNLKYLEAKVRIHAEMIKYQETIKKQAQDQSMILETIFEQVPIGIGISLDEGSDLGGANKLFNYNPEFLKICNRSKEELTSAGWNAITHPDDLAEETELFQKLMSGEIDRYSFDKRIKMPDDSFKWVHIISVTLDFLGTAGFHYAVLMQDIDEEKRTNNMLRESERSKSVLLSNIQGMAFRCKKDGDWTMELVSSGCQNLCGCRPECLINNSEFSYNELIVPEYREHLRHEWEKVLAEKRRFHNEYEIIDVNGIRKWVMEMGEGVCRKDGTVEALEGIVFDISERKEMEDRLRYLYEHDEWTDLYNLNYLETLLLADQTAAVSEKCAFISLNLNEMYSLSLRYGMHYSQRLIKLVAKSLLRFCNQERWLFSTASYRLIFYIKSYQDRNELLDFCEQISILLHSVLDVERIDFGIGVYEVEDLKQQQIEEVFKKLLIASEEAFNSIYGASSIYFYDDDLEQRVYRKNVIQQELALIAEGEDPDRIFLQFQPIVDLSDNRITEFEALARFDSRDLGLVPPLDFIPVAEETKDIIPIGKLILKKACGFLKQLLAAGHDDVDIAINISAVQILSKDFVESIGDILAECDVDPAKIHFELTESVFSEELDQINAVFGQLSNYGIRSAIDDFGTAYSSLSRLRELNVDTIKIDRPFIAKINELKEELTVTNDIISMAHKMDLYVVAEGVETQYQYDYLQYYGADKVQGYLIGKPMDEAVALDFLKYWGKDAGKSGL